MDKAFESGLRFNYNIVLNYEQIKRKLNKNTSKNSLTLPKIESRNMHQTTSENNNNFNFNSLDSNVDEDFINPENKEKDDSITYETNFYKNYVSQSNEPHNNLVESFPEYNLINIQNEVKNDSYVAEKDEPLKTPRKELLTPYNRISYPQKDSEELKSLIDKEILGKGHNSYVKLRSESLLRSIKRKKSSMLNVQDMIQSLETEENNDKSQYDRFFKTKRKLQTSEENHDEEHKKHQNEEKEVEFDEGFFELGLKKPKRKIQITIFTQKNKNHEELKDLEQFMKKLELNNKDEMLRKTMNESQQLKANNKDKRDILKTSPVKHPLVFPEFNKYGLYSGHKKQEMKMKYGYTVLKMNKFNRNRNSLSNEDTKDINEDNSSNNFIKTSSDNLKEKSASPSPRNEKEKKVKKHKLPKIKEKLQLIYKENPAIIKDIKKLKNETNLTLEEYQLKLMDVARKFLDDENMKNLANRFKEITEISQMKEKAKYHKSINRWEIMVKSISRYIPEFLVEKLISQK